MGKPAREHAWLRGCATGIVFSGNRRAPDHLSLQATRGINDVTAVGSVEQETQAFPRLHVHKRGGYASQGPRQAVARCQDAPGPRQIRQYGPRRLWDEVEAAFRCWAGEGKPALDCSQITITPNAQEVS
jgi:hypothetical protein